MAASTPSPPDLAALRAFVRAHGPDYLLDPNITSVGIGHKVVDGTRTDEVCVQFTVAAKVEPALVAAMGSQLVPPTLLVDDAAVPTDVLERGYVPSYQIVAEAAVDDRKVRIDPVTPGVSVGHPSVSAGTIGCVVYDTDTATPHILSNWHVLQGESGAIGDVVLQPGAYDDNRVGRNRLGVLTRSYLGVAGDCAIARVQGRRIDPVPLGLSVAPDQIGDAELGDRVVKSGRTTEVTEGVVTRIDVLVRLDYGAAGEHQIGGFEISPPETRGAAAPVSAGGDSGSAWLFKARNGRVSTVLAGLHFAGSSAAGGSAHALACLPRSVFDKLQITLSPQVATATAQAVAAGRGYDAGFLATRVEAPGLVGDAARDVVEVEGSPVVPYTHFSLTMSRSRRMAHWVGWNVDGARLQKLSRSGLRFRFDPRLPASAQIGDDVYAGNRLDRGHLARRADLTWGPEAQQANDDSFFFTNITPQLDTFNQAMRHGVWGRLEDALYAAVEVDRLRISVFGGPVLDPADLAYRGVQVPKEFWKVIAYEEGGTLKARAFVLTQNLDRLETLDLSEFATYQVTLAAVTSRTGVTFDPALSDGDMPQDVGAHVVRDEADIRW